MKYDGETEEMTSRHRTGLASPGPHASHKETQNGGERVRSQELVDSHFYYERRRNGSGCCCLRASDWRDWNESWERCGDEGRGRAGHASSRPAAADLIPFASLKSLSLLQSRIPDNFSQAHSRKQRPKTRKERERRLRKASQERECQ